MFLVKALLFLLYSVHTLSANLGPQKKDLTEACLSCICQATTGCNRKERCKGDVCGPFWITKPYWIDGYRPTLPLDEPSDDKAFERCAFDPVCAGETIRNYMNRYARDCNNDAVINCYDYAAMHRNGAFGCSGHLDAPFLSKIEKCLVDIDEFPGSENSEDYKIRDGEE